MVSLHEEDNDNVNEDRKERQSAEGRCSLEPEKAHAISEFVILASNVGYTYVALFGL